MRYEVYGIYNNSGVNYQVGVARSLKSAQEVAKRTSRNCKAYAILVKQRQHTIPLSIYAGYLDGPLVRATSLIEPYKKYGNPIEKEEYGKNYWSDWGF